MTSINEYIPQSSPHPSEVLEEVLEERGMGAKEFAIRTGKPEKTISAILAEKSGITPDMAVQFEKVLNMPANIWMNLQRSYDEYIARVKYQDEVAAGTGWALAFPYSQMAKLSWVKPTRKAPEKVDELFRFFQVSSKEAWEKFYFEQELQVVFRISLRNTENPYAIAAWLRGGELLAERINAPSFDRNALKAALPEIKALMVQQPDNFFYQLQAICLRAGVKVVFTPCLPKTRISGATRWINGTPIIQLSCRYKRNDSFWFTFFHEVGHILKHGKKYISLESISYEGENETYEAEADEFAIKWTLPKNEEKVLLDEMPSSREEVIQFAEQFNTHPAIIVGRLQHLKKISHKQWNDLKVPISLS